MLQLITSRRLAVAGQGASILRLILLIASILMAGGYAAAQDLVARRLPVKPLRTELRDHHRRDMVTVKFRDGLSIRAERGTLTDRGTGALGPARGLLRGLAAGRWRARFDLPEQRLVEMREIAQRNRGRAISDLNLWFHLFLRPGLDAEAAINALNGLQIVEIALPVDRPPPPPLPPDFEPNQGYLFGLPGGVNAQLTWTEFGQRGAGVAVCDVEYSWNTDHLDLPPVAQIGPDPLDPFSNTNHGTAVLGIIASTNNGWGTTGIASSATLYTSAANIEVDGESVYDVAAAVMRAADALQPGDIILIEQQAAGPRYTGGADQFGLVPAEWRVPTYDAVVTAVGNGIIVVEAAGNGSQNLDDEIYGFTHAPFTPEGDSGAFIVGGGTIFGQPILPSNHGSTVDLQGWEDDIWSTGYGGIYSAEGPNLYYLGNFGGTSGAAAMVAGACALFQSNYQAVTGQRLTPDEMKRWLQETGYTTPGVDPSQPTVIGPRPDVARAVDVAIQPIHVRLLDTVPTLVPPGVPISLNVQITENLGTFVPGSAALRYRFGGGPFKSLALDPVPGSPTDFTVELPAAYCGESPEFYIEAMADDGSMQRGPFDAPDIVYDFDVGNGSTTTLLEEDFESGLPADWSTTGLWHVSDLCATDPTCGGALWAHFGDDGTCNYDFGTVNGRLTTPLIVFPPSGVGVSHQVEVCHSLTREPSAFELAEIRSNGVTIGKFNDTGPQWLTTTVELPFLQDDAFQLYFYFDTRDEVNNRFPGWFIDRVKITRTEVECTLLRPCPADCTGDDRHVDVMDLLALLASWGTGAPGCDMAPEGAPDGVVDINDLLTLIAAWGPCDGG